MKFCIRTKAYMLRDFQGYGRRAGVEKRAESGTEEYPGRRRGYPRALISISRGDAPQSCRPVLSPVDQTESTF